MSYRYEACAIFAGDSDTWACGYMKDWNESEHVEFDFYEAHDLRPLTDRASKKTVRARLRQATCLRPRRQRKTLEVATAPPIRNLLCENDK